MEISYLYKQPAEACALVQAEQIKTPAPDAGTVSGISPVIVISKHIATFSRKQLK
jgi:hypothetical protein